MAYKTVYLFRHGETDWNAQNRLQGRTADIALNTKGIAQANALANKLSNKSIKTVYSSPLKRAHQTAEIVANCIKANVTLVENLQERSFGILEGLSFSEIQERYPELKKILSGSKNNNFVSDNGYTYDTESLEDTQIRIYTAITEIIRQSNDDIIVISSHGSTLYNFLLLVMGNDNFDHIPNAAVLRLQFNITNNQFIITNDTLFI